MKTISGLNIEFYINDQKITKAIPPDLTALKFIRETLGLTGTKETCNEGDCGSCTIAFGRWENNKFVYRAMNSCILPAAKLHNCHVITIEGLAQDGKLNIIQQAMLDQHAVQCGFCSSGIIMALFCLLVNNSSPTQEDIFASLEGNLCRCTGYRAINFAALDLSTKIKNKQLDNLLPPYVANIKAKLKKNNPVKSTVLTSPATNICESYLQPQSLPELFQLMKKHNGNCKLICGGSDLMVAANLQNIWPKNFIDISAIKDLQKIKASTNKVIIGAGVTLSEIQESTIIQKKLSILSEVIHRMSSHQVRNIATLAGNIANASPVADAICILLALDATVVLCCKKSERRIKLEDFYCGYKTCNYDTSCEVISAIEIPIPDGFTHFEKIAKRIAMDIATVNSAINFSCDKKGTINKCRIAFGGVAITPSLAKLTAKFLIGKKITDETCEAAGDIAAQEFKPISDVRGSEAYRKLLIKNHVIKLLTYDNSK